LGLLYSEQMKKGGRERSLGVRRAYNECLIELNEALWSH
jgi:hypothetical protein